MKRVLMIAIVAMVVASGCARKQEDCSQRDGNGKCVQWGQSYTAAGGQVMQPDHSFMYYWFWMNMMNRSMTPTYHAYVPPQTYTPPTLGTTPGVVSSGTTSNNSGSANTSSSSRSRGYFSPSTNSTYRPAPSTGSGFRSSGSSSFRSSPSTSFRSSGSFSSRPSGGFRR